jgi:hypothetical protein
MSDPLILVLDETGTTNRPQLSVESDFGVGGIVFGKSQLPRLAEASRKISKAVKDKDYKYKDVQRSTEARKVFLNTVNGLSAPSGVYGFFSAGGSLLKEKERAIAEMAFLESDDGGHTASLAEQIRRGDGDVHLAQFLKNFASCIIMYAGSLKTPIDVHWDRRSDLPSIQDVCDAHNDWFSGIPHSGDVSRLVSFKHTADGELSAIARFAGIVAGDVRFFFRKHGHRIWSLLAPAKRLQGEFDESILKPDTFIAATTVATVNELLADLDYKEGSKETCILQGYSKHFIKQLMSFASPNGVMGHLLINHGSQFDVIQEPD